MPPPQGPCLEGWKARVKQTFLLQALLSFTCTRPCSLSAEATALPALQGLGCSLLCLVLTTTLRLWQRDKPSLSSRCQCPCPSRNKMPQPGTPRASIPPRKPYTQKEEGIKSGAESTRHRDGFGKGPEGGKHMGPEVPMSLGYSKAERGRGAHAEPLNRSRPVPGPNPALTATSTRNSAAKGLAHKVHDMGRLGPSQCPCPIHCDLPGH